MRDFFHSWDVLVLEGFPNHSRNTLTWLPPHPGAAVTFFKLTKETQSQSLQGRPEGLQGALCACDSPSLSQKRIYGLSVKPEGRTSRKQEDAKAHIFHIADRDTFVMPSHQGGVKNVLMQQPPISLRNNLIPVENSGVSGCMKSAFAFPGFKCSTRKLQVQDDCSCNSLKTDWPWKHLGVRLHKASKWTGESTCSYPVLVCWIFYRNDFRAVWATTV